MDYLPFSDGVLEQIPCCIVYFKLVPFTVCPLDGSLGAPEFQTCRSASTAALTSSSHLYQIIAPSRYGDGQYADN